MPTLALATELGEWPKQPNNAFPAVLVIGPLNDGSVVRGAGTDALGIRPDKPDINKWRRKYHLLNTPQRSLTSRSFAEAFQKESECSQALRRLRIDRTRRRSNRAK